MLDYLLRTPCCTTCCTTYYTTYCTTYCITYCTAYCTAPHCTALDRTYCTAYCRSHSRVVPRRNTKPRSDAGGSHARPPRGLQRGDYTPRLIHGWGCQARIAQISPKHLLVPGAVVIHNGSPVLNIFTTSGPPAVVNMKTKQCSLDEHSNTGSLR